MRHLGEIDGFSILVEGSRSAIALVIAEAVFDTDNDPVSNQ